MDNIVQPLYWPNVPRKPVSASWLTRIFAQQDTYTPTVKGIREQLLLRPSLDPNRWGNSSIQVKVGEAVCKLVQKEYQWPNSHFMPEDPFDIVFLLPWDDMEIVEIVMELENVLHIHLADEELQSFNIKTLGNFVDLIVSKVQTTAT